MKRIKFVMLKEARKFIEEQTSQASRKIYYNINKIGEGEWDAELFKKLKGSNIWEIRTLYDGIAYRLFAFWDKEGETLVVATHGIAKKKQKTPQKEIDKAEDIRKEYFKKKQK